MKYAVNILSIMLMVNISFAQDTPKKTNEPTDSKALVESRRFEFVAESANPLKGRTIFLSPGYTLKVLSDTVAGDLPYYGRAYQASMNPGDAGIKFTSTDSEYSVKPRKKNGWEIQIKPKDVSPSPQINLSVNANGSASLRVTSIDRQSISFNGYIRTPAKK